MNFTNQKDKTLIDKDGRIIFFSKEQFLKDIVEGDKCFICGADPNKTVFNNEHVIPKWIQKDTEGQKVEIVLPNGERRKYGEFVIPCCASCNSLMGKEIEKPISNLVKGGYRNLVSFLDKNDPWIVYTWLARIFLKFHIKDKSLRKYVDFRMGSEKLGDEYAWEQFHYIHCLSRAFYTQATLHPRAMGSLFILPLEDNKNKLDDISYYGDYTEAQVVVMQVKKIGFIAVFNDCGATNFALEGLFDRIGNNLLNLHQLIEIAAHAAVFNLNLINRPDILFIPNKNLFTPNLHKDIDVRETNAEEFGEVMSFLMRRLTLSDPELLEKVKTGNQTFLWNKDGSFMLNH